MSSDGRGHSSFFLSTVNVPKIRQTYIRYGIFETYSITINSVTSFDTPAMSNEMNTEQFALFLVEACKQPDIKNIIKDITTPNHAELADTISAEVHRQMMPMKDLLDKKDNEIRDLKRTIAEQKVKLDYLEQHGRRDSLRIAGIPENPENDDTDAAVLGVCAAIKVDPPVEPQDIASHWQT